jgi:hypothetical protein
VADPSETTQISGPGLEDDRAADESSEVLRAIRDLSDRVGDLQAEVHSLRAQTRALPPGSSDDAAGWDDSSAPGPDMLTWVRAVDAPGARVPAVPRLLLEIVFLVAVAVAAAIAELEAIEIVGVMAAAWLLVALAELVAARAARRRAEMVYAPLPGLTRGYPTDPSWFAPSVERPAALGLTEVGEDTQPRLPPPSED